MTADTPSGATPEPGPDAGIDEIQADIDKTRQELGHTVDALAAKADVKGRAQQKAADTKDRITETAVHTREALTDDTGAVKKSIAVAAVIAVALVVGVVVWRRRR